MAYTPGLKIKENVLVRETRRLPVTGKVLVNEGDTVNPETVIAETELPGSPAIINAAFLLGLDGDRLEKFMIKKEGESVNKEEIIGRYRAFWGLINRSVKSPVKGTVELVSKVSGQVVIREPPIKVSVNAYIPGVIAEVLPEEGAIVEIPATFIQGIFGIGGERHGELLLMSEIDGIMDADNIGPECNGKIIVIRTAATSRVFQKAIEMGAIGIVLGGINEADLVDLLGYELGVAITGRENIGLTIVVTEGFGEEMRMSEKTYQLLMKYNGNLACINGATQIRAGVVRPEIIIPQIKSGSRDLLDYEVEETEVYEGGLMPGTPIRVISEPYFGAFGHVIDLPPDLQLLETESKVRILRAELEDGRQVIIPRANVEIMGG